MSNRALVYARVGTILSVFFGGIAFQISHVLPAMAQTTGKVTAARDRADIPSDIVVKEAHITLLKFALNLRPAQEPFWAPVEAALREMAQWQATTTSEYNSDERMSGRSGYIVVMRLKRIAALAVPLIKALDEDQRRSMMMLARSAGLEQLLASK